MKYSDLIRESKQSLLEGGNVFKTEPDKKLIASRIATADVKPTIDWLNSTFGFKFTPKDVFSLFFNKKLINVYCLF